MRGIRETLSRMSFQHETGSLVLDIRINKIPFRVLSSFLWFWLHLEDPPIAGLILCIGWCLKYCCFVLLWYCFRKTWCMYIVNISSRTEMYKRRKYLLKSRHPAPRTVFFWTLPVSRARRIIWLREIFWLRELVSPGSSVSESQCPDYILKNLFLLC